MPPCSKRRNHDQPGLQLLPLPISLTGKISMTAVASKDVSSGIHANEVRTQRQHNAKHQQFVAITTLNHGSH